MIQIDKNLLPEDLPGIWRETARILQAWLGNEGSVQALHYAADQLEHSLRLAVDQVLTLPQAAAESGYSADHLARLVREQPALNAGRKHAPRIRRRDLPRKPGKNGLANGKRSRDRGDRLFRDIVTSKLGG